MPNKLVNKPFVINQGIKALSQSINGVIPVDDNIEDRFTNEVKLIAFERFAQDFDINISEITEAV